LFFAHFPITDLDDQCKRLEQSLLLRDGILSSAWSSLSGGERQRAAIALGLLLGCSVDDRSVNHEKTIEYPKAVLLLDEPTAACDATSCQAVEKALIVSGLAMIMITHDDRQAQRIAHRRIIVTSVQ
jgi:ABC-type iron transport system FetAB ATPase subunit